MNTLSMSRGGHLRVMANVLSGAVLLGAVLLSLAQGIPTVAQFTPTELARFTSFTLMLTGLVVGLFLPPVGGMLTLTGFAAFWAANMVTTGGSHLGGVFALFPIAAMLQLASWWRERRTARRG